MLQISNTIVTGAHNILSFLLVVIVFNIALTTQNTTTPQIADVEKSMYSPNTKPARIKTTNAIKTSSTICTNEAKRILGGKRPGNFPPIAISPQGAPKASAN